MVQAGCLDFAQQAVLKNNIALAWCGMLDSHVSQHRRNFTKGNFANRQWGCLLGQCTAYTVYAKRLTDLHPAHPVLVVRKSL